MADDRFVSRVQQTSLVRKYWTIVVLVAVVFLGGCAGQMAPSSDDRQTPSTMETKMTDDEALPQAAPAFAAHFTDPVYNDPAGEFAPFGTDEGADMLDEWAHRRDELHLDTTVADLIDESGFADVVSELDTEEGPGIPIPGGQVDAATITIGAGFTLLRLTGHIDEAGRRLTLKALDVLIRRYGSRPELVRQRADLESWTG